MTDDEKRTARRAIEREIHRATGGATLPVTCCECRRSAVLMFEPNGDPKNPRPGNMRPYCGRCFARLSAGR
jgi:hypothetical protein